MMSAKFERQCIRLQESIIFLNKELMKRDTELKNKDELQGETEKNLRLANDHIANLTEIIDSLKVEVDSLRTEVDSLRTEIDKRTEEKKKLSYEIATKDKAISELQEQIKAISSRKIVKMADSVSGIFSRGGKKDER